MYRFIADFCMISIHALREEGDRPQFLSLLLFFYFYPRPPRGGRQLWFVVHCQGSLFLSTPSARRATFCIVSFAHLGRFLSTPSARRATVDEMFAHIDEKISIHALREEGDS